MIRVDPGPEWKGYYLPEDQHGVELNFMQGIRYGDRFFTGLGVGYLNFNGVQGFSLFFNTQLSITKARLRPVVSTRVGYSRIWNQYEAGTGTMMAEGMGGMEYILRKRRSVYLGAGILFMQQSMLCPLRAGFVF